MARLFNGGRVFILAICLVMAVASHAAAHRLVLRQESQSFKVVYDNGTAAMRAVVKLLDGDGRVVWQGVADDDGRITPPVLKYYRVQADDSLGHIASLVPGRLSGEIPRPLAAALGISFFLFVASAFNYWNKKHLNKD